ncbi:MAG: hypothetical protein WD715_12450 [Dongiaceae bacterium]
MPALPAIEDFGAEEDEILLQPADRIYAEAAARLAARFMAGSVTDDGLFRYEFDFVAGTWSQKDNIVRQAGATSALGAYLATLGRDSVVETALQRVLRTLSDYSIHFRGGQLVSTDGTLAGAQTGATALALHGEVLYAAATGDQQFAEARAAWIEGILGHWDPALGMRRTPIRSERSPYFDGETWLALATYIELFPGDARVADEIGRMDTALMSHYREQPNSSFFHWGALASRVRHRSTGDPKFIAFAAAQAAVFLTEMRPYINPQTTTCSSVEGLASIWHLLAGEPSLVTFRANMRNRVLNEQHKNALLQIRPGQTELQTAPGVMLSSEAMPDFTGAYFNARHRPQSRIDTTQHCLNAWLQMLN